MATLAGVFAVPVLWAVAPLTAQAAMNCVVSAGVIQTGTVVTGTPGNATIDCGGTITGGLGIDTCQGPAPDPDIHASCESTSTPPVTGPGSGLGNATALCYATGGVLSLTVNPVGYICVVNPLSPVNRRVQEASNICTGTGGTFVNLLPLSYACLLPTTPQATPTTR